MILDLHRQGLSVSAIARESGIDRKTVRKYIARGLEAPAYGPRKPRQAVIDPFTTYLRERVMRYPGLTGSRLFRELKDLGYGGGYTAVTDFLRDVHPAAAERGYEVRFETSPGEQAQVDFAQFNVVFADEPTTPRIVWLFSMVLGFSRLIWARFVVHQDLPTVLRCHAGAFEALGGAPREVLYDRMKTAVIGEGDTGGIVYNRGLVDLARHHGFQCPPFRAKTLDHVVRRLEKGEIAALEAIDVLLSEELTLRENSRIKTALRMGRLATIKTLGQMISLANGADHFGICVGSESLVLKGILPATQAIKGSQ